MQDNFISIKESFDKVGESVNLRGWVYRERGSNKFKFIVLRDSSGIIQCVISKKNVGEKIFGKASDTKLEASIKVSGKIKEDDRAPSGYEMFVDEFEVVGESPNIPLGEGQTREFLDDNRHLKLRTSKMINILKIRSTYIQARDEFFRKKKFFRFDAPILQPSQSEGGSTLFEVKYYDDKTYLSQSWQLYGEAGIFGLEKIYNMGPTFRAEKSKTSRHLSEFWMAEMEAAWMKLDEVTAFAKEELKYCIKKTVMERSTELKELGQDPDELLEMVNKDWPNIKYRKALEILKEKEGMNISFGKDLRTIEEKNLMKHFDVPVVVTHYPTEAMAFYKPKDENNPDEALCFDMLAPLGYGEIIGGSERSLDVEDMKERLEADGENVSNYDWYFDTRRYGSVPHSGYGVGIERVIRWICGVDNIKDTIPFPRTPTRYKP
ncbi:MAG: asparagine--tRNA ligase [Candidatus Woesearchaeota archaeon]